MADMTTNSNQPVVPSAARAPWAPSSTRDPHSTITSQASGSILPTCTQKLIILGVEVKRWQIESVDLSKVKPLEDVHVARALVRAFNQTRGLFRAWLSIYQLKTCTFRQVSIISRISYLATLTETAVSQDARTTL